MSLELLLRDGHQRSIALVSNTHALIFRHDWEKFVRADAQPRCVVEFISLAFVDLSGFKPLCALKVHGTLGLAKINSDIFICIISSAARVATVRPGEDVQRIVSVDFCQYLVNSVQRPRLIPSRLSQQEGL